MKIKIMKSNFILAVIYCIILNKNFINALRDPYEILGVKKTSSINEIKRNYKNLVKIWHPDKSYDPKKKEKFFEINEAYKLLMNPVRREDFDKYKVTEDTPNFQQNVDYSKLKRFEFESSENYENIHLSNNNIYFNENLVNHKDKYFKFNYLDFLHKQTISHKAYSTKILPSSIHQLQLILFYSDSYNLCPSCSIISPIWHKISNELNSIGINFHTINVDKDRKLSVKIGINTNYLPSVIGIVNEIVRFYKDDQINSHKIILFIRKLFGSNLIQELYDQNYMNFLDGWKFENKVRVLFLNHEKNTKLRYLTTAFKYKEYASFGHIYLGKSNRKLIIDKLRLNENSSLAFYVSHLSDSNIKNNFEILNKYNLDFTMKYMLIFNENSTNPIASLNSFSDELKAKLMWETLEANKFLLLPKISSQKLFEQICPVESIKDKRILCTILVTSKKYNKIDFEMQELRKFIKKNMFSKIKFKFAYITLEDQKQFLSFLVMNQTKSNKNHKNYSFKTLLSNENSNQTSYLNKNEIKQNQYNSYDIKIENISEINSKNYDEKKLFEYNLSLLVISRTKWNFVYYEWLDAKWDSKDPNFLIETQNKLYDLLIKLSSPKILHDFSYETNIASLVDESEKNFFQRIFYKLYTICDHLSDHFTRKQLLPIISVILSILFVALIGYIMQYLVKMEERKIEETYKKLGKPLPNIMNRNPQINSTNNKLLIHELKGETYNGLVRLLKPGCRTLVLLCDLKSRCKLLPKFYKAIYPYRRNKTLMFGYLMIEKNLEWYRKILEQTLDKQKILHLNPKNCIGTVLSLNGFRKYFCVYHAKHMELHNNVNNLEIYSESSDSDIESGNLLNNSKPFLIDKNILIDELLLDGLNEWLEKLFNAKTHRYFISYWPTHMK